MMSLVYKIFEWPFELRFLLFLVLWFCIWQFLGKYVLKIISVIPFLLERAFILLYLIVEIPIAVSHKLVGGQIYKLQNIWADIGSKIDASLSRWYVNWHFKYENKRRRTIIIMVLLYIVIVCPSYFFAETSYLNVGKNIYCTIEQSAKERIEKYLLTHEMEMNWFGNRETNKEIKLIVHNLNTVLYVRDIPDINNGIIVEDLYNGDCVMWNGEMQFVEWEYGNIEILAKVVTENGIEGWSLLDYLYPENFDERKLKAEVKE